MNIQTQIRPELWQAVARTYEARSYKSAILDAFHYLTDVIREKGDVEGDGAKMIGPAFGGANPRIQINKLQTQSERDAQAGLLKILEGMYQGIRNPRSHEQVEDSQDTADAIILFINYVLGVIDTSKGPFVLEEWLERVFDPDFVRHERYAKLLVDYVPPKRYVDAFITLYRQKMKGEPYNAGFILRELMKRINPQHVGDIVSVVSNELRVERNEEVLKHNLIALPQQLWSMINEDARLRIENKLIRDIEQGTITLEHEETELGVFSEVKSTGSLGAEAAYINWDPEYRQWLFDTLYDKTMKSHGHCAYVIEHFLVMLPNIAEGLSVEKDMIKTLSERLWSHFDDYMLDTRATLYGLDGPDEWTSVFRRDRRDFDEPLF